MEELAFKQWVDELRSSPKLHTKLTALLKERHHVYYDKSANAVIRMRGYVLYSLYLIGLPDYALIFVYEELESSREAYLVAAAAKALRKSKKKSTEMAALLLKAFDNIKSSDNFISFDNYYQQWPLTNKTTATNEILTSMQWLGAYAKIGLPTFKQLVKTGGGTFHQSYVSAIEQTINSIENDHTLVEDCCGDTSYPSPKVNTFLAKKSQTAVLKEILLEDHNDRKVYLGELIKEKVNLIAFFYTRCDNPLKCSLTITKLADLQRKLATTSWGNKVNLLAISYDSFYDLPYRMKKYGEARGMMLNEQARMCRVLPDISSLSNYLDLGVNYTGEVVNRHTIELYLLDDKAQIVKRFSRRQIDNSRIMADLEDIIVKQQPKVAQWFSNLKYMANSAASVVWPVMVLLLPKCPFCFAAYFSVLGIASMQVMPYFKYIFPILLCAMAINIYALYKMSLRRNSFLPLYLCVLGSVLVMAFGYFNVVKLGLVAGLVLLFMSATLNSLPNRVYWKLLARVKYF